MSGPDASSAENMHSEGEQRPSASPPTGRSLGNAESERARIMGIMNGVEEPSIGNDDGRIGADPGIVRDMTNETGAPLPELDLEAPPEAKEDDTSLQGLLSDEPEEGYVTIGGEDIPLNTVSDWRTSWENGSSIENERNQWRSSVQLLGSNPVEGLGALGVSPDSIVDDLRRKGFISGEDSSMEEGYEADDSSQDVKKLQRQVKEQGEKLAQFESGLENRHQYDMQQWRGSRVQAAQDHVDSIINKAGDMDSREKGFLKKAVHGDILMGIDSAPRDLVELKSWAKTALKTSLDEFSDEDVARAAKAPKQATETQRSGEVARESKEQVWDKVNLDNDDDRRKGAMAWLNFHSQQ